MEESIRLAKKAIVLDVKDGNSWCKLFIVLPHDSKL